MIILHRPDLQIQIVAFLIVVSTSFGLSGRSLADEKLMQVAPDVSDGILNLRKGPGLNHPIIVAVPEGAIVRLGPCAPPDDGKSQHQWCKIEWQGNSGWVSSSGLIGAKEASDSDRVQEISPLEMARAGIVWFGYTSTQTAKQNGEFQNYLLCPYRGDGDMLDSVSKALFRDYESRGFTLKALCLSLANSEVKFDPQTGKRLNRYQLPGYGGEKTERYPFWVPDCFSKLEIIEDRPNVVDVKWRPIGCTAHFDPKTGNRISDPSTIALVNYGGAGDAPDESAGVSSEVSASHLGSLLNGGK